MKKKAIIALAMSLVMMEGTVGISANDKGRVEENLNLQQWMTEEGKVVYPLTPNDFIWSEMTYVEQVEACNMPQELVDGLSTEELVNSALEYPFLLDFLLFDSYDEGIEHMKETSNVYKELYEREDVGEVLIDTYAALEVDYDSIALNNVEEYEKDWKQYGKEIVLQNLLASDEIFNCLDSKQINELIEVIGDKYAAKKGKCEHYQTALLFYDSLSEEAETISEELIPASVCSDINSSTRTTNATGFVKNTSAGIIGMDINGAVAYYDVGTYTLYETSVPCYRYVSGEWSNAEKDFYASETSSAHPSWVYLSGASRKYNCHSYCWISTSVRNIYWLDDPTGFARMPYFSNNGANTAITSENMYIIIFDSDGAAHSVRSLTTSYGSSMTSYMTTTTVVSKLGPGGVYQTTLYDMYNLYAGKYYIAYSRN